VLRRIRSRITYSNVIASLALFIALGGGAYAAIKIPKNSVGSAQIKSNAVISSKVKPGSLLANDFKAGQLPQGQQGIQGPKGDKGDTGTVDTSNFYTKGESDGRFTAKDTSGVVNVPTTGTTTLLTHGTVTFTATCADLGASEFEVIVNAQSSEANSTFVESGAGSQTDLAGTPTELDRSSASVFLARQQSGAVVTPTQAFNAFITRGVNRGGASNCFAGVTVLP
jgi:hypothetical protein